MINLRSNYPVLDAESEIFTNFVSHHLNKNKLLQQPDSVDSELCFKLLVSFLNIPASLLSSTSDIQIGNSATLAIFAILSALRTSRPVIGVEKFTYSGFKKTAGLLGYQLYTVDCDEQGMIPEAMQAAIDKKVAVFYVQPTIQNPTCAVMSMQRRNEIADIVRNSNAILIEDDAYRFLHPDPPPAFLKLLPEKTIHIFSFAKPYNSFIKTCFIIYPKHTLSVLSGIIDEAGGSASSLSVLFSQYLLQNSDFKKLINQKQKEGEERQQLIQPLLNGLVYSTFPTAFHIWISLPGSHHSKQLVGELLKQQILITGSHECSAENDTGFIRIALSSEKNMTVLQSAVKKITALLL